MRFGLIFTLLVFLRTPARTADSEALAISRNIQARHLPHGTILDPIFAGPHSDRIVGYTRAGDSAIWTGHYLAAEAFRYKVRRDPEALANIRAALSGIERLIDVTGSGLLARCALPAGSPWASGIAGEEKHHGVHYGVVGGKRYLWLGNTSRDQYSGVFFGLGMAYDMVDDGEIRSKIRGLATRMLEFLLKHDWMVMTPGAGPSTTFLGRVDQQLALLQIGRHVNPGRFSAEYQKLAEALALFTVVPIFIESWNPYRSYHKFNIDAINLFNLVRLEDSPQLAAHYRRAYGVLRQTTGDHGNAFFDVIDQALNGQCAKPGKLLESWLRRPRRDVLVDLRGSYPECDLGQRACRPIPVERRVPTDFLWQRSPFQLSGNGKGVIEGAGIDYLLPYWWDRLIACPGQATSLFLPGADGFR